MASSLQSDIVAELVSMGYAESYIVRALKIHQKSKFGINYNVSLLVEIIGRLKAKDEAKSKDSKKLKSKQRPKSYPKSHRKRVPNPPPRRRPRFIPHFASSESVVQYLNSHNLIDYRFENGRYILCEILFRSQSPSQILIHPQSLPKSNQKHDRWCSIDRHFYLLAVARSITLRPLISGPMNGLKCDDFIDLNPRFRSGHGGWKHGQITKMDPHSGQCKV